jgi:hypothetical protein
MEWQWATTTTLPVVTFMVGLWWNRRDADRREDRAFHRDTILELQDTLELLWGTATGATTAKAPGEPGINLGAVM